MGCFISLERIIIHMYTLILSLYNLLVLHNLKTSAQQNIF
jgi:hypothetical protein